MGRRATGPALLVAAGAALGVLAGWGLVRAQDMTGAAQAVRDSNAGILQAGPTTTPSTASVPGFAGNATDLQSYSGNPTALQNDGTLAEAGTDQYGIAQSGTAAPGQVGLTGAEPWLQSSINASQDPMSLAGGTTGGVTGQQNQQCQTQAQTNTSTNKEMYTCETSTVIDDETKACSATYQPVITQYTAICDETFDYATNSWVKSGACTTAPADPSCTGGPRTCVKASTPQTLTYSCQTGYVVNNYTGSCTTTGTAQVTATTYPTCWMPAGEGPDGTGTSLNRCDLEAQNGWFNGCVFQGCPSQGGNPDGTDQNGDPYYVCSYLCPGQDTGRTSWTNSCNTDVSNCAAGAAVCVQGPGTRNINGVDVYRDCWAYQTPYACTSQQNAAGCSPPAGYNLTSSTCAASNAAGQCTLYSNTYSETVDPAGGCADYQTDYACARQSGGAWVNDGACEPQTDQACKATGTTCLQGAGTEVIDGVSVYEACWRQQTTYDCQYRSKQSDCNPAANCKPTADACLDDPPPADPSQCLTVDHQYDCSTTTTTTTPVTQCGAQLCLQDTCFTMDHPQNTEFAQTFSQLSVMDQVSKDYQANQDLTVFKGQALKCRKAVLGFLNCCKDSGWGPTLGLAQCNADEKTLINQQAAKATHYVGTYCSNTSLFGICLEKSMAYCSFGGALARIVQEAGHQQLPKSWGASKSPDCSGFTIDQFQQLDLTHVDFSDFYTQKLAGFQTPDAGSTASNIQASISSLYATGQPSTGGSQ